MTALGAWKNRQRARLRGVFPGWWMVALAVALQIPLHALFFSSFGLYFPILQKEFGWSTTAISLAVVLKQILAAVLSPIQGWLLHRFGPKAVMTVGIVFIVVGLASFSLVNSLSTFYLAQLIMMFGATLTGMISLASVVVNWFERRRATALSLMTIGMTVGGLMAPLLAGALIFFGWREVALASSVFLLIGFPLVRLFKNRPEDMGLQPDGGGKPEEEGSAATPKIEVRSTRQALRTREFWLVSLGHGLAVTAVSALGVHFVNHLITKGYSLERAASFLALVTLMSLVGKLAGGYLGDRFGRHYLASIGMLGHTAALVLLVTGTSTLSLYLFAITQGVSWGLRGPLMSALKADFFGRHSFAKITGFSQVIVMVGSALGPIVCGLSFDWFGSYSYGFSGIAVLTLFGSLCFLFLGHPGQRPTPK
jgi:MFS family permease